MKAKNVIVLASIAFIASMAPAFADPIITPIVTGFLIGDLGIGAATAGIIAGVVVGVGLPIGLSYHVRAIGFKDRNTICGGSSDCR